MQLPVLTLWQKKQSFLRPKGKINKLINLTNNKVISLGLLLKNEVFKDRKLRFLVAIKCCFLKLISFNFLAEN